MEKIITKRILPIRRDLGGSNAIGSMRVTITPELRDLGIDPESDNLEGMTTVSLVQGLDGKKRIVIEKVEGR